MDLSSNLSFEKTALLAVLENINKREFSFGIAIYNGFFLKTNIGAKVNDKNV
ncbi:hypothetical protein FGL01_03250 [Flavobacterium glycines]|uniref:Uncharacterized protein n=1 Tax=Flavobacterium glycines TaxID=551990 RepID=A0A511CA91_9FLAO|nr:hypothetical protein FGL01_03250 [Flavobacterium glycines]